MAFASCVNAWWGKDTTVEAPRIAIDTCVLISALRSRRGASQRLLRLIDSGKFEVYLSMSLVLEYEAVGKRLLDTIPLTAQDLDAVLDYLCKVGIHQAVFYLWRPSLPDTGDDMVLELAVAAGGASIVTFNARDFRGDG